MSCNALCDARFYLTQPLGLRVKPPGVEWKTGESPKLERVGPKKEMGHGPKWEKKTQTWQKNRKMTQIPFFAIFGPFFSISGRGP